MQSTKTEVKERPIIFSSESVKAIIEGRKTMTRRIVKPACNQRNWLTAEVLNQVARFARSIDNWWTMAVGKESRIIHCGHEIDGGHIGSIKCPYGKVGDKLWVRETWSESLGYGGDPDAIIYRADSRVRFHEDKKFLEDNEPYFDSCLADGWKPSIFMPRWASRITLEITNIKVERLQDISPFDAEREGIECAGMPMVNNATGKFQQLWNKINGADSWSKNPFVWVISFRKL